MWMTVSEDQGLGVFQFGLRMFIKMHIDADKVNNLNKGCSIEDVDPEIIYLRHSCLFTKTQGSKKYGFIDIYVL